MTVGIEDIEKNVVELSYLLKSLSNEKRLLIICALIEGEKCVGDLEQLVGLSQSALSQHLARLRRDEVVKTRRDAQTIYYSLKNHSVKDILMCLSQIGARNAP